MWKTNRTLWYEGRAPYLSMEEEASDARRSTRRSGQGRFATEPLYMPSLDPWNEDSRVQLGFEYGTDNGYTHVQTPEQPI